MKQLTLYTYNHEKELRNFAKQAAPYINVNWAKWQEKKRLFGINVSWVTYKSAEYENFTNRLMIFLEEIAINNNPIYKHSQKLITLAQDLMHTKLHNHELVQLKMYLKNNKILHLEGYTTFRMEEYRNKLDILAYSLIKKLNLMQID